MTHKPLLVVIAGPTAAGKTDFAIRLATTLQTEIISFDSRQFYREISIGTAKPSTAELNLIKHHFIDSHSIAEDFNAASYEKAALTKIDELAAHHRVIIAVGGSGLYLKALLQGLDFFPETDPLVKSKLEDLYNNEGLGPLHELLHKHDPAYFGKVDLNNPRRIIRALEVCLSAGLPYSGFTSQPPPIRNFNTLNLCLSPDRNELYARINLRVDKMIGAGFIEEALGLKEFKHLNPLRTVGYSELFCYFDGQMSLPAAIELIKQNTRRYGKRQLTWFRNQANLQWITSSSFDLVMSQIHEILDQNSAGL